MERPEKLSRIIVAGALFAFAILWWLWTLWIMSGP